MVLEKTLEALSVHLESSPCKHMLGLCWHTGFSLVAASGGYSLGAVGGLLIVVASLIAEHRL